MKESIGLPQQQDAKILLELTMRPPIRIIDSQAGCFNECLMLQQERSVNSGLVVLRAPKPTAQRALNRRAIQSEFDAFAPGVVLDLRTSQQQVALMTKAAELGLKTPGCLGRVGEAFLMEYVDGVSLDQYVQLEPANVNTRVIEGVLNNLHNAHKNGIVIGDRWTRNTRVIDDRDHSELDYDFYLRGNKKKTTAMDLAQTLYHLLHFSYGHREFMRDVLLDIYARNPQLLSAYNLKNVRKVLAGQANYFYEDFQINGKLYEGFIPPLREIFELIEGMEEIAKFNSKISIKDVTIYEPVAV